MKIIALGMLTMLGGCVMAIGNTDNGPAPVAIERETITYETTPCYGICPVYSVTIQPSGVGVFEGKRHTAFSGTRAFTASPAQYRAFAAKLQPYRPTGAEEIVQPGTPACGNAPSDMPSVDVRWTEPSGGSQHLSFYYGCRMHNAAMNEALRSAPNELPLTDLIGKH